jgi:hypothetical protein
MSGRRPIVPCRERPVERISFFVRRRIDCAGKRGPDASSRDEPSRGDMSQTEPARSRGMRRLRDRNQLRPRLDDPMSSRSSTAARTCRCAASRPMTAGRLQGNESAWSRVRGRTRCTTLWDGCAPKRPLRQQDLHEPGLELGTRAERAERTSFGSGVRR